MSSTIFRQSLFGIMGLTFVIAVASIAFMFGIFMAENQFVKGYDCSGATGTLYALEEDHLPMCREIIR